MHNGPLTANHSVTVTGCGPTIAPVTAQSVVLDPIPGRIHTLTFDLRTSTAFSDQNQCQVWVRADTGRIFHQFTVAFPAPTGGGAD